MKRIFIPVAILAALALPGVASAHTPTVTRSCSGLILALSNYEPGTNGQNNRVTVTIDGVATVVDFGGSYSHTFPWSQTADHSYTVVVDANRNQGTATQYDAAFQGTQVHCQEVPATTTVAPTTTVASTTTIPATTTTVTATTVAPTTPAVAVIDPPAPSDPTFLPADPIRPSLSDAPTSDDDSLARNVLPRTGLSEFTLGVAIALVGGGAILALIARRKGAR